MVEFVKTFKSDTQDSAGRFLVEGDSVSGVFYYDTRPEDWRRDFTDLPDHPVTNYDFTDTTVTGTAPGAPGPGWYETGVNVTSDPRNERLFKIAKIPFFYEEDIFAKHGTVLFASAATQGNSISAVSDYFASSLGAPPRNTFPSLYEREYYQQNGYATTSGRPGFQDGVFILSLDATAPAISSFYIDSANADGTTSANSIGMVIGQYTIQVATSGTGLNADDYQTIASGTNPLYQLNPLYIEVPPTQAKFVKLIYKNSGSSIRTNLFRFFAFSQETIDKGMSVKIINVHSLTGINANRTIDFSQNINFAGLDYLYFDIKDYANDSTKQLDIRIDGSLAVNFVPQHRFLVPLSEYIQITGYALDIRALQGHHTLTFRKIYLSSSNAATGRTSEILQLANFRLVAPWYDEGPSDLRGDNQKFPDECVFSVDSYGMSVIELSNAADVDVLDPRLWMRFRLGERKMMQLKPRAIAAREGRVFMATSRGLYVLDFPGNCCWRFTYEGLDARYGIDLRNRDGFIYGRLRAGTPGAPPRIIDDYVPWLQTPVIPCMDIYDVAVGYDSVIGEFVVLGTARGLLIYNGLTNSSATFLRSKDRRAVLKVKVLGSTVWYTRGKENWTDVAFISDVGNISANDFVPDDVYQSQVSLAATLSGTSYGEDWDVVNYDSDMDVLDGTFLTISGTHTRGGATGLVSKEFFTNRSFIAKVKVRINKFPVDARGALRFGFAFDYFDAGLRSMYANRNASVRQGFFLSALNSDPFPGKFIEDSPFQSYNFDDQRGWYYASAETANDNHSGVKYIWPRSDGAYMLGRGANASGQQGILKMITANPVDTRDFTARLKVKILANIVPTSATTSANSGVWFGVGSNPDFSPGAFYAGASPDILEKGMFFIGNTTFSGTCVYTVGDISSSGLTGTIVLTHGLVKPAFSTDNQGANVAQFREWRIDYDYGTDTLRAFLDDQPINSFAGNEFPKASHHNLGFGLYVKSGTATTREAIAKDFKITFPPIHPDSQWKYSVETIDPVFKAAHHSLKSVPTYSGIYLSPDTSPSSSTLELTENTISPVVQNASFGYALPTASGIDAVYLQDGNILTDGWNSNASKRLEVWTSSNNASWALNRTINLNNIERTKGISKLNFTPSLSTKFVKFKVLDVSGNYVSGGGTAWTVFNLRPMVASGIDFSGTDGTDDAEFREWKLVYDAPSRQATGYVDNVFVSENILPYDMERGQFVLLHDLSPVNSGTSSEFAASFKDLEITFSDPGYIVPGTVTGFSVIENEITSSGTNYTILTASENGVGVADIELGPGASLPNQFRTFSHNSDIFGDSKITATVFGDSGAHRDSGLVFVGTSALTRGSELDTRFNKPFWNEHYLGVDEFDYGSRMTLSYHPGINKLFFIQELNTSSFILLDPDKGTWTQISRGPQNLVNPAPAAQPQQTSAARAVYSPQDDRLWLMYGDDKLDSLSVYGDVSVKSDLTGFQGWGSATIGAGVVAGGHTLSYILHNHTLALSKDFIERLNVVTNSPFLNPLTGTPRWNRNAVILPWADAGELNEGTSTSSIYCDFDKKIYIIAATHNDAVQSTWYFSSYDPDKDYLNNIYVGNFSKRTWPYSDSTVDGANPPVPRVASHIPNSSHLVYVPFQKRIYILGAFELHQQLYYFDLLDQKIKYSGENLPYIVERNWPTGIMPNQIEGVGQAVYHHRRKSIFIFGSSNDEELYEYILERNTLLPDFEYIPARDGLPTASGLAMHSTHNSSGLRAHYNNTTEITEDFYTADTDASASSWFTVTAGENIITLSGVKDSISSNNARRHLVSSKSIDSSCSFDVSAKIAFPKWALNPFFDDGAAAGGIPEVYFVMGLGDGALQAWTNSSWGTTDQNLFQIAELRAGVRGTEAVNASVPFRASIRYCDGQNLFGASGRNTRIVSDFDNHTTGLDLGTESPEFKEFRLSYSYETDTVEGFVNGVSVGSTVLRRKLDSNGTRAYFGLEANVNNLATHPNHFWVSKVKDINFSNKAWDRIENGRLVTSISGSVGSYYHERFDTTLTSGVNWVYETETYFSTYKKFPGFDYIGSIAGIGDGRKLFELVSFIGPSEQKFIGVVGQPSLRHDSDTYLAMFRHEWDDDVIGRYLIVKDTEQNSVNVYVNGSEAPAISVPYTSLPEYRQQHIYYGKSDSGNFEKIYGYKTLKGSWSANPDYNGADPVPGKRRWKNSSDYCQFEQITQVVPLSTATYELDQNLGRVDLYTFYVASGADLAIDTPYTITSSGIAALPVSIGGTSVIHSISSGLNHLGQPDPNATIVRVDQRRLYDSTLTSTDQNLHKSSGWVYLGTFNNPSKVVVTARAHSASSFGMVCAGAIGVQIGQRSRSTFDMNVKSIRYLIGATEFPPKSIELSGISVIDLDTNERIDSYGTGTAAGLPDSNITSGDTLE